MSWWQALPAMLVAAALLFVPGFIIARAIGARGFASAALSPLFSCGLVGVAGIIGGFTKLPWNIWLLLGATVLFAALGYLLRRLLRRSLPSSPRTIGDRILVHWASVAGGLIAGAFISCRHLLKSIGQPENFAQVYDNVFHLNAIRYILETGNASTLTLGRMINPESAFATYPSVWHSLGALISQLTSFDVFVSQNALTVVTSAVLWPFACIALVRAIVGSNPIVTVATGALSAGFWIFPYQLLQWGPLFPNTLSYSLLPLALLAVASLLKAAKSLNLDWYAATLAVLIGAAALLLTQPNGFSALLILSVPLLLQFWLSRILVQVKQAKRQELPNAKTRIALTLGAGVLAAIIFCLIWKLMLLPFNAWQPSRSIKDASVDVLTGSVLGGSTTLLASVLALIGILAVLIRRRGWWVLGSLAVAGVLYVVAAAVPPGTLRSVLLGSWYQDPYRLAALVPLFVILLAAFGIDGMLRGITWLWSKLRVEPARFMRTAVGKTVIGIAAAALTAAVAVPAVLHFNHDGLTAMDKKIKISYSYQPGWVVSTDEYTLMSRLNKIVPPGAVVAVDPFNGGSLAYAISGVKVTQYHLTPSPDSELLSVAKDLSTAGKGSETCSLARQEKIQYILDFGDFYMLNFPAAKVYPGFVNVPTGATATLVDQQGAAKLYKVSC